MCNCFGNGNCSWIILLIIICCGFCGGNGNCGNSNDCGCGCNGGCGC